MDAGAAAMPDDTARSRAAERLRVIAAVAVVGVVILAAAVFLDGGPANFTKFDGAATGPRPEVGQPAPELAGLTTAGTGFTLSSLKGHPVWLTFGASWCIDCRNEAPDLEATYQKYRDQGLVIVGVFVQEDAAAVTSYAQKVGFDFTMVPDPTAALTSRYGTLGFPTHLFIGADGIIKDIRLGGLPVGEMDKMVAEILH
jgi:cytochrome c biogenesis protein CcmG/thiol:disulfide interchange protein DsbE